MGTLRKLLEKHGKRKAIVGLTAWDYPSGLLAQRAGGIDMVLVSDSLGKIVLGLPGSIGLSLDDMIHHAKAVARAVKTPFLLADLPMGSYEISPEQALTSAIRMIKEAPGVSGVKLEGGKEIIPQVSKITSAGIPVFCQVGITPQRTIQTANDEEGTGRSEVSASEIFDDAICLQNAGAVGIMLTAVSQEAAKLMRDHLTVPTIGIGSGKLCDGQMVFQSEILGYQDPCVPQWHSQFESIGAKSLTAIRNYVKEVGEGEFPGDELTHHLFTGQDLDNLGLDNLVVD